MSFTYLKSFDCKPLLLVIAMAFASSSALFAQCPTVAPSPTDATSCGNSPATISVASIAGTGVSFSPGQIKHRWYTTATGGSDQADALGVVQLDPTNSRHVSQLTKTFGSTVSYWVSGYCVATGAETPRAKVTYTATTGSAITIALSPTGVMPTNLCNEDNPSLTANGGGSTPNWEWRKDDPTSSVISSASTYAPIVSGTYYLSGNNTCNTRSTTSILIGMKPRVSTPTISRTGGNTPVCGGIGSTAVNASAANANSFIWSIANAGSSTITGTTATGTINWDPAFYGTANVTVTAYGCNGSSAASAVYPITVKQPFPQPTLSISGPVFVCPGSSVVFQVDNATSFGSNPVYRWYVNGNETTTEAPSTPNRLILSQWNFMSGVEVRCTLTNNDGCSAGNTTGTSNTLIVYNSLQDALKIVPAVEGPRCAGSGTTQFTTTPALTSVVSSYSWGLASGGSSSISQTGLVTWNSTTSGNVEINVSPTGCTAQKAKVVYAVLQAPASIGNKTLTACDWEPILYDPASQYDINWYTSTDQLISTGQKFNLGFIYTPGVYTYKIEPVSPAGCRATSKTTLTVTITDQCDDKLNWTESKSYNPAGTVTGNSKSFFDYTGKLLQGQTLSNTNNKVYITQALTDRNDKVTGSVLGAPSSLSSFKYFRKYLWSTDGTPFDYQDIDNPTDPSTVLSPRPMDKTIAGTPAWYYSSNNVDTERIPTTDFPYSRTDYYSDGTGEVRRAAAPGDEHRLGKGHEVLQGTFPVFSELNDYLIKRRLTGLTDLQTDNTMLCEGVQSVSRDQNGLYMLSVSDDNGRLLMTARPGTLSDKVLTISNTMTSSGDPASLNFRKFTYFYLLTPQAVTISGSTDYVAEDIVSEVQKAPGQSFAGTDGKWPAGFYRIILNNPASQITLGYTNYLLDVSYQFYDDAGRLKASLSPNGYTQLTSGMFDANGNPAIDMTLNKYNFQGRLLEMIETDAGATKYRYRRDGKIRFSQNALQASNGSVAGKGKFSYTHYDKLGRPVESGEYIGTKTFDGVATAELEYSNQVIFAATEVKDWVKTNYDYAFGSAIPNLPSTFQQTYVRNAVSWTENANIKTWYSYDEFGRMTWMAQQIVRITNRTFVTEYTYDINGNVTTVKNCSYSGGNLLQPFFHHYEYDADQRLAKVYTSIDGTTKNLRATYAYYSRGPLKRIELGNKIQGIDFVYNINGWLTQINHPEKLQDPGADTNDVFGMILDYYESAQSNLFGNRSNLGPTYDASAYFLDYSNEAPGAQQNLPFFKEDLIGHLKTLQEKLRAEESSN
jgi:hypothetical protein